MIEPIKEEEGGKALLKERLNQVIFEVNCLIRTMALEKAGETEDEANDDEPAEVSDPFDFDGFTDPHLTGYLQHKTGYKDEQGSDRIGLIKFDELPAGVLEAHRQYQEANGIA